MADKKESYYKEVICETCSGKCYIVSKDVKAWSECPDCKIKASGGKKVTKVKESDYKQVVCKICLRKCYILSKHVKEWSDCPDCKKKESARKGTDGNKVTNESKSIL